jgi:hypothetical protein
VTAGTIFMEPTKRHWSATPYSKPLRTQAYNETEAFEKFATIIISNYWSDKVNAMTDAEYDKLVLVNGGATS